MKNPIPVVVLNWNGLNVLKPCLESLQAQEFRDFEIYLVDNGSNEKNKMYCKAYAQENANVRFFNFEKNLGFAPAVNNILQLLMDEGKAKYVALLNNDTEVSKNWLGELVDTANSMNLDMVASKQVFFGNPKHIDNLGLDLISTSEIMPVGAREKANSHNSFKFNLCPSAGAGLYSMDVFKKVGLFDTYFKTCYEDADLGLRAALAGFKSGLAHQAVVKHRVSYSVKRIKDDNYGVTLQKNMLFSYFSVMPTSILFVKTPLVFLKTFGIALLAVVTFRFKLLKAQVGGVVAFLQDYKLLKKRRHNRTPAKFGNAMVLHKSFMAFYLKYLKQFILKNRPTVLE